MHHFYLDAALSQAKEAFHSAEKKELEQKHVVQANVVGSITCTVMFLELSANTLYIGQGDRFARTKLSKMLNQIWSEGLDRRPMLSKYAIALALAGRPPLDASAEPYQSVKCVLELRNALMHPKAAFGSHAEAKLKKSLEGRYKFAVVSDHHSFFPDACLSPHCAIWALTASIRFVNAFYNQLPPAARDLPLQIGALESWQAKAEKLGHS